MAQRTTDPITDTVRRLLGDHGMPRTLGEVADFVRDVLDEMGLEYIDDDEERDVDALAYLDTLERDDTPDEEAL